MDAGEGITQLKRLRGVILRESTYELVLTAMPKATPPYDTLTTFIDNAVEVYARTLLTDNPRRVETSLPAPIHSTATKE